MRTAVSIRGSQSIGHAMQMAAGGLKEAHDGKPVGDVSRDGEVGIEDFRGDSVTDDVARKAVIKSIVDIEQKGDSCATYQLALL